MRASIRGTDESGMLGDSAAPALRRPGSHAAAAHQDGAEMGGVRPPHAAAARFMAATSGSTRSTSMRVCVSMSSVPVAMGLRMNLWAPAA